MMIHRHFEEKELKEEIKTEPAAENKTPAAVKVDEGADIVPEPAEKPVVKPASTRTRRKK